ncbi:MAG: hypothetical protein ACPGLV_00870 [Bacteroidia bacterium]
MANQHLNQAQHNHNFYQKIQEEWPYDYPDWKVTVLFYIALHCVDAVAELNGMKNYHTHKDRNTFVSSNNCTLSRNAKGKYRRLLSNSISSRYSGFIDQSSFETIQENNHTDCLQWLGVIKDELDTECNTHNHTHSYVTAASA